MYESYKNQIEAILAETEKKALAETKKKQDMIAPVAMYKLIIGAISKYVEAEASKNKSFNEALSLEWKSAERLLRYIWKNAEKLAIPGEYSGMKGTACVIPSSIVYSWVNEYYFLDDKLEVEREEEEKARKKAEAEEKARIAAELEEKAREKAIEKLSYEDGWEELTDEEKEKKIKNEARAIKSKLEKKKITKTAGKRKKKKEDVIEDESLAVKEEIVAVNEVDKMQPKVIEFVKEEQEQFSLYDLM